MDDKRTLIAFLLVGLIFLMMPLYYELVGVSTPRPEPESVQEERQNRDAMRQAGESQEADAPGAESTAASPSQPAATAATPPAMTAPEMATPGVSAPAAVEEIPERRAVIVSPLQRFEFSSRGGVLVSAQMEGYQRAGGGPVELVGGGGAGLGLTIDSEAGRGDGVDLRRFHFEPDRELIRVADGGEGQLRLRAQLPDGRLVDKVITVRGDQYGALVDVSLNGFSEDELVRLHWSGGIGLAEREPDLDLQSMKSLAYINESLYEVQVDDDESETQTERGDVRWVGVRNKYFLSALSPNTSVRHRVELSGRPLTSPPFRAYEFSLATRWGDVVEDGAWRLLFYAGPLDLEQVARYERDFARAMDLGFPVVRQIAKVLLMVFVAGYEYIPNYGWLIVVFGVVVKILVYPLTHKSYESAARMQELQPKIAALREKYKNNNQKLSQETMKLYREEGVNPLGGCLPLLFQMPIFIALYQVFSSAIQLRQTPWILWVDDLSLPDTVAIGGFDMHVLPLLMSLAMFFQSKMTMKDPKQAALVYLMPVVMVFIMWSFSSGLVLYWTVFNVLQIGQQVLTNHLKARKQEA